MDRRRVKDCRYPGILCGLRGVQGLREIGQYPSLDSGLVCGKEIHELYLYTPGGCHERTGRAGYRFYTRIVQDSPSNGQGTHHLREAKAQYDSGPRQQQRTRLHKGAGMAELRDGDVMLMSHDLSLDETDGGWDICHASFWRKDKISRGEDADRLILFRDDEDRCSGGHHDRRGLVQRAIVLDELDRPRHDGSNFNVIRFEALRDDLFDDVGRRHESEARLRILD